MNHVAKINLPFRVGPNSKSARQALKRNEINLSSARLTGVDNIRLSISEPGLMLSAIRTLKQWGFHAVDYYELIICDKKRRKTFFFPWHHNTAKCEKSAMEKPAGKQDFHSW